MQSIQVDFALATGASNNLKDRLPNPALESSIPPNKKDVKSSAI
jgi:hypothetical protein